MNKLLIVEDDEKLNKSLCSYLSERGFDVTGCLNAEAALLAFSKSDYDAIISDIMMPKIDGFAFAKAIREDNKSIPILFMSALNDIPSKSKGFNLGIDDYLVKPFDLCELELRINALLRRANIAANKKIHVGNLTLDAEERSAYIGEEELSLTVREFDILFKLLSYPKRTFTRAQLMEEFWDYDSSALPRTVDVYMVKIREKTAECDGFEIVTRHGLGYKAVLK